MANSDFSRSYWIENWRRTSRDWESRQFLVTVAAGVISLLGFGYLTSDPRYVLYGAYLSAAYLALQMLVLVPWKMWRDSCRAIAAYEEALRPRVSFAFDPENPPFVQQFPLTSGEVVRIIRVGLRNDSRIVIPRVRVVLESTAFLLDGVPCPPSPENPLPIEHALNIMGIDHREGLVDLSPGDRPVAYVDVVQQRRTTAGLWWPYCTPCYATSVRSEQPLAHGPWQITIRVEGGNTYARHTFKVDLDADGRLGLTPLGFLG